MAQIKGYKRPETVEEALRLLSRSEVNSAVLAGGTALIAHLDSDVDEVVDLQAVGMDRVSVGDDRVIIGAMARVQDLVDHPDLPETIRVAAHREGPNTFRHMGTVGGLVAGGDWESELYAAFLVYEAATTIQTLDSEHSVALADLTSSSLENGLITAITLSMGGSAATERLTRTPADRPIVAVVGRKDNAGVVRLAFCGLAVRPLLLNPKQLDTHEPPADFRGSSNYRREMAITLSRRVLSQLT